MKILYISNSQIPSRTANSVHVVHMCEALANNGHQVLLLAQQKSHPQTKQNPFLFYNVPSVFRIKQIPITTLPLNFFLYLLRIAKELISYSPELVYTRSLQSAEVSTRLSYPTIFETHMPVWEKGALHEKKFTKLVSQKNLLKIVVITDALKEAYLQRYPSLSQKIIVSPDGARKSTDQSVANLPGKRNGLKIGYVGSLNDGKGIEIITKIAKDCPDSSFYIVGGDEKSISQWKSKTLSKNIFFMGFFPQNKLSPIINAFDICLLPNQEIVRPHGSKTLDIGKYTSPLKLFEYMAHGKAIIASDLKVLREVLNDKNALLVTHDNPQSWIRGINSLQDPEKRKSLGQRALQDFLNQYTWEHRAEIILSGEL